MFIGKHRIECGLSVRNFFKLYCIFLTVLFLGACVNPAEVNDRILADQGRANAALDSIEPKRSIAKPLVVDHSPWYGARAIPIENVVPVPSRFLSSDGVVLTFDRPLSLLETGRLIQAATGIRVSVQQAPLDNNQGGEGDEILFLPVDGVQVAEQRFVWSGPLPSIMAQIEDVFDANWSYDGNMITVSDELTRTFMLHALADDTDFSGSIRNSASQGGAVPEVSVASETTLEIWDDIQGTVESIIQGAGRATFSPTTGTITLTGKPSAVKKAEIYLRQQNKMRLRRVAVGIKVLTVETTDTNSISFDLSTLLQRALNGRPFQFTSTGNGLTAGILRTLPTVDAVTGFPGAGVTPDTDEVAGLIEASEEVNRVSLSNSGAVVTLSDIPAPLQIGRTIAFLERITATSGDAGNISLEPGEINVGLTMNVLPRVIQRDKVLLKLAVGITDAQTPFQEINVGELRIQLPEIATTGFLQNAVLSKGEMLVLAGFERNQASLNDSGTPGGLFTGGTRAVGRSREVTVLLITADVLPEDPLTIVGN